MKEIDWEFDEEEFDECSINFCKHKWVIDLEQFTVTLKCNKCGESFDSHYDKSDFFKI